MAYADFYVRQEKFEEALPYLQRVAKHVKGARNKARIYFLMGQINNHLGNKEAAYKALSKVIRLSLSLVGSEMCIRDSAQGNRIIRERSYQRNTQRSGKMRALPETWRPVLQSQ